MATYNIVDTIYRCKAG